MKAITAALRGEDIADMPAEMAERKPKADAADGAKAASDTGKLPQSQRPGGKKRMVAAFVAFVGAGYSVGTSLPYHMMQNS